MSEEGVLTWGGVAFAFIVGWCATVGATALRRRSRVRSQVEPLAGLFSATESESSAAQEREGSGGPANPMVARLNSIYPLAGGVRTMLIAAVLGVGIFAALVPVLGFLGLAGVTRLAAAALLALGVGWSVGRLREDAKRNEFQNRFLIGLEDFHRMVRHGISSGQALKSVASASDEPVKTSLRNVVLETEFGVPTEQAMDREAQRVRSPELAMLAAVILTQTQTGGTLSEAVANLAAMLRERMDNQSRLRAATAESRITLIILALVPILGVGLQAVLQPDLVDVLINDARHLLGIGSGLIVAGLVISWLMMRRAQR